MNNEYWLFVHVSQNANTKILRFIRVQLFMLAKKHLVEKNLALIDHDAFWDQLVSRKKADTAAFMFSPSFVRQSLSVLQSRHAGVKAFYLGHGNNVFLNSMLWTTNLEVNDDFLKTVYCLCRLNFIKWEFMSD